MRIIGLLSWYRERPELLGAALKAAAPIMDHVVCVDGRYAAFEADDAVSSAAEYMAVQSVLSEEEIGWTIHRQPEAFEGNEVEKRSILFKLGDTVARPGDWLMVLDADEIVQKYPDDLRQQLAATKLDVGIVRFVSPEESPQDVRIFFRAGLGIRVDTNHYTNITADGRVLWGNENTDRKLEPALDLRDSFEMLHLTNLDIGSDRHKAQHSYYKYRDGEGLELGRCEKCHRRKATRPYVPVNFEVHFAEIKDALGKVRDHPFFEAGWMSMCDECFARQKEINDAYIRKYGIDPDADTFRRYKMGADELRRSLR